MTRRMTAHADTTARDVRQALAPMFGGVKFSVRVQNRKTGERWLVVSWTGGPSIMAVHNRLPAPKWDEADPCPFHLVKARRKKEK